MQWKPASQEPKPKGQVLVVYLKPFFGKLVEDWTIGYYDDPEDYEDGDGKGWCMWHDDFPIYVTHWAELPALPEGPEFTQEELVKIGTRRFSGDRANPQIASDKKQADVSRQST